MQRQGHARGRARAQRQADARAGFFPPHLCVLLPGDLLCPHALKCLGQGEEPQGTYRPPRAVLSTVLAVTSPPAFVSLTTGSKCICGRSLLTESSVPESHELVFRCLASPCDSWLLFGQSTGGSCPSSGAVPEEGHLTGGLWVPFSLRGWDVGGLCGLCASGWPPVSADPLLAFWFVGLRSGLGANRG